MTSPTPTLTDEQIDMLWMTRPNIHNGKLMPQLRDFARAILAANEAAPAAAAEGWKPLPPLPTPDGYAAMTPHGTIVVPPQDFAKHNAYAIFTADQMHDYVKADRAASPSVEGVGSEHELRRDLAYYKPIAERYLTRLAASPAGEGVGSEPVDEWRNDAAAVMARFISLSAVPNKEEWAVAASTAIRLLNAAPASPSPSPAGQSEPVDLSNGFDGSAVRAGPNHSTIEIWYETEAQARAAHKVFRDLIDGSATAGQSEPVAWDALADQLDAFLWTVREFATLHHGDKHNITVGAGEAQNLLRAYRRAASPAGVQGDGWSLVGHFQHDDHNGWRQVQSKYANDYDLTPLYRNAALPAGRAGAEGGETQ